MQGTPAVELLLDCTLCERPAPLDPETGLCWSCLDHLSATGARLEALAASVDEGLIDPTDAARIVGARVLAETLRPLPRRRHSSRPPVWTLGAVPA